MERRPPVAEWRQTFGDEALAAGILDRPPHDAEVLAIDDPSFGSKTRTNSANPVLPRRLQTAQGARTGPHGVDLYRLGSP